jgi:hypothetical protein
MDHGETGCPKVDRISLAQDKDQWQILMKSMMKFRVP